MQLWIEKHKPKNLEEIVGNKKVVEELKSFVLNFKPGEALMFYGPTGIGKSLLIETFCGQNGFLLNRIDADDVSVDNIQEIKQSSKNKSLFCKNKIILIDELEGISGTKDRGATTEIIELIKNSKFPLILITSDPYLPKLKTVKGYCKLIKFDKIPSPSISKRLGDICAQEGIEADKEALITLSKFCQGDLRSAITDLQIACSGKKILGSTDLEALGYRERENSVFNALQPIFHSRNLSIGRNAMLTADKDSDEVFWWVENNLLQELKTPEEIAEGYDLLSHADILRGRTMKQQNWRFKAIASDLISGISVLKKSHTGFVMYRPPQRFMQLGRAKAKRLEIAELSEELGNLHCSRKKIAIEYLPYMKLFEKAGKKDTKLKEKTKDEKKDSEIQVKEKIIEKKIQDLPENNPEPKTEIKPEKPKMKTLFNF